MNCRVLFSILGVLFLHGSAYADLFEILKEKGIFLDQEDARTQGSNSGGACDSLKSQPPGTYLFTQSRQESRVKLCYVDESGKIKSTRLKVKKDRIRFKDGSSYLDLELFLDTHSAKLKQRSPLLRSLSEEVENIPQELMTVLSKVSLARLCPENPISRAGAQGPSERIQTSKGTIFSRDPQQSPLEYVKKTAIFPCGDLEREKGIHAGKPVAKGSYGSIDEVCFENAGKKDCDWVTKSTVIGSGEEFSEAELKEFFKESSIIRDLDPGLAPQMLDAYVCRDGDRVLGRFVMKKMEGDLVGYLKSHSVTEKELTQIMQLIQSFHENDLVHQDLHANNILYRMSPNGEPEFYISDFGLSHQFDSENPNDQSPNVPNFRGRGGGGTHEQQIAYDYESILSDLKAVFGIEIKLETNLGTITPVSLPKGTTRLNQALLRQKMIEAQDDPERRMGNQVIVAMPGTFGVFKEIDPKLMSTEMGSRLEGHAKLKNIVIDLRK